MHRVRGLSAALLVAGLLLLASEAASQSPRKFYPDDPLWKEPAPAPTYDPEKRALSGILDYFTNTFTSPGERHPESGVIPALNVNTLGEVPDSLWFTNRHARRRRTAEELARGPRDGAAPAEEGLWSVLTVKQFGERPGMLIADENANLFILRFDPGGHLDLATGAELVSSRLLYGLGYNVMDTHLVYFERQRLQIASGGDSVTSFGETRDLLPEDIDRFLQDAARDPRRGYRAVAVRVPREDMLGPFQLYATRADDPNDVVPHEHRRELRGLFVVSSWIAHDTFRSIKTMDVLDEREGVPAIRHYLVDFFATLGSAGRRPKYARAGNERRYDLDTALKNIAGLGGYAPAWQRANYPRLPGVGRFECEVFDPGRWTTEEEIAAFENRLPDDTYWAARQVLAFSDDDIRAIVAAAEYGDPAAAQWIGDCLITRRDKIGRAYLGKVLPLDDFAIVDGRLHFVDLEVRHGFVPERVYSLQWSRFDNVTHETEAIAGATGRAIPETRETTEEVEYLAVEIRATDVDAFVTAYVRRSADSVVVVGIDRTWPGKMLATATVEEDSGFRSFETLDSRQVSLLDGLAADWNERTGRSLGAQEFYDQLAVSERSTFEAVTHALMNSALTDADGKSLGDLLDYIERIRRIAGQYYGRRGDEQFRLYADLKPSALDALEQSREFNADKENTVYHIGFPISFRQAGRVPSIQVSVSEDGARGDIDVDYRSSKFPQALFNGHLTSANSDVRAGDNHDRHDNRWAGLTAWWKGVFGKLKFRSNDGPQGLDTVATGVPTALPANRSSSERIVEAHDAMREFLTDWLVRRTFDEAVDFVSAAAIACINIDDDVEVETLGVGRAELIFKDGMRDVLDEISMVQNLAEIIEPVVPWKPEIRIYEHPFDNEFVAVSLPNGIAEDYLCGEVDDLPEGIIQTDDPGAYGTYFGTLFRFRLPGDEGGVLGLLWARVEGFWRIVSYRVFQA